jgi:hypothetical protein
MDLGSRLPPGIAAHAGPVVSQGTSRAAPPTAPAFRNCRLLTIVGPPIPVPQLRAGTATSPAG